MTEQDVHYAEVPGGRLRYTQQGEGPDLVLLNAGTTDLRQWEPNLAALTAAHRVTRYDDRGVGRYSSAITAPWSPVDDLRAVLDRAGVAGAVLVGSSDGGRKALDFAVEFPELVRGLMLVGSALHLPDPDPAEQADLDRLLTALEPRAAAAARADLAAAVAADLAVWGTRLDAGQRAWLADICAGSPGFYFGHPAEPLPPARPGIEHLASLTVPTLVAVGEYDHAFTHHCADRVASGLPGAHRVTVAGADHFVNVTAPATFAELVNSFTAERS
ncbi:alpha/beta fold hydrolase [Kitasatospora sp. P5_F3]